MSNRLTIEHMKNLNRWVWYTGAPDNDGNIDKAPRNPTTGSFAMSNEPATWGDYQQAIRKAEDHARANKNHIPGTGIELGPLGDGLSLIGIDLDNCMSSETQVLEGWASKIIERFGSYCEISPRLKGVKIFLVAGDTDINKLKSKFSVRHKREFKRNSHYGFELHLSNSYFTVTFNKLFSQDRQENSLSVCNLQDLIWLIESAGPAFLRNSPNKSTTTDDSGSGHGFRFALQQIREQVGYDEFLEQIRQNEDEAGDWANRVDERQLKRAFDNAQKLIDEDRERLLELFPDNLDQICEDWQPAATESSVLDIFSQENCDKFRFNGTRGKWFIWNGWCWRDDNKNEIKHAILDICTRLDEVLEKGARNLLKNSAVDGVKRLAQCHPQFSTIGDDWDTNPDLLATPQGTSNLITGILRPSASADLIGRCTYIGPAESLILPTSEHCPRWMAFLKEATGDQDQIVEFLQRWFGYSLTGHTREQKFLFIHGRGQTGKSTLVNVVSKVAGAYAIQIDSEVLTLQNLSRHPTSIARLNGPRMVIASETKANRKWDQQLLKQITGGDPVVARAMRQDEIQFTPQLKLTVVGNNRPSMTSVDSAMQRRMIVLPIDRLAKDPDSRLMEKLDLEGAGILSWMIEGCVKWQESGLQIPRSIQDSTNDYFQDQDMFQLWINGCCEQSSESKETYEDLFISWLDFAEKNRLPEAGRTEFTDALKEHGYERARNVGPKRARGYSGLRLISPDRLDDNKQLLISKIDDLI